MYFKQKYVEETTNINTATTPQIQAWTNTSWLVQTTLTL